MLRNQQPLPQRPAAAMPLPPQTILAGTNVEGVLLVDTHATQKLPSLPNTPALLP